MNFDSNDQRDLTAMEALLQMAVAEDLEPFQAPPARSTQQISYTSNPVALHHTHASTPPIRPQTPAFNCHSLFVKTPFEAHLIVEAAIGGNFPIVNAGVSMNIGSSPHIQSGSVVVFAENNQFSQMLRFRDGRRWSPSRPQGPFLLYREVEAVTQQRRPKEASTRFTNVALRLNSQFVSNGLAKRTLRVLGSDGLKYRVISYFYPTDVEHLFHEGKTGRLILPSNSQEFKPFISKLEGLDIVGRPDAFPAPSSSSNGSETSTKRKRLRNSPDDSYTPVLTRSRLKSAANSEAVKAKSPVLESLNSIIECNTVITQSVLEGNFGNHAIFQVNRPIPPQCPCGGLGVRKAADYFRGEKEAWTGKSVWLAPLNH